MPYMYEIADSYGVDQRVSGFCIPIGVTLNADGSALFICTAVLFLAQLHGVVMDAAHMAVLG
jgi:proton glutamate symport protein